MTPAASARDGERDEAGFDRAAAADDSDPPDLSAPWSRRRLLAATAAAAAVGLAGCGGGGGGDGDADESADDGVTGDGGDSGEGNDGSTADGSDGGTGDAATSGLDPVDVPGENLGSAVDGIAVRAIESHVADGHTMAPDGVLAVNVTVENTGDRETKPLSYNSALWCFDADGETLNHSYSAVAVDRTVAPGETGVFTTWGGPTPEEVARYELSVDCDSPNADGVYCD